MMRRQEPRLTPNALPDTLIAFLLFPSYILYEPLRSAAAPAPRGGYWRPTQNSVLRPQMPYYMNDQVDKSKAFSYRGKES